MPPDLRPGPHPPPHAHIAANALPLYEVSGCLYRFHLAYREPIHWGIDPPRRYPLRFDSPDRSFGVLYTATDPHCAFIESFGHATGIRYVAEIDLANRQLSRLDLNRALRVVDLTGAHLAQLGADARLFAADYAIAQVWSAAFHYHPCSPDGIRFHSRHDPDRLCIAIFDRAACSIERVVSMGTLAHAANQALLADILRTYRFGLSPAAR